ncbi:PhoH family protein [bacterium]|nr:PhoH family protein [bacterium]
MEKRKISLKGIDQLKLLGSHDEHLHLIENAFDSQIVVRGDEVVLSGEMHDINMVERIFAELIFMINRNGQLDRKEVETVVELVRTEVRKVPSEMERNVQIILDGKKGIIRPKTKGQDLYYSAVLNNDIVFVIGPAGTGKTYLAVAMALAKLRERENSRIILTRPAIEAGENLGFLPGDLMEKIDPYLRPLTDALFDILPSDQLQKYIERKIIEIIPLAYMRGRTLNDAFVILDEAQNTSPLQMKMFLTRLGIQSRAIITGDVTQIDLIEGTMSGLVQIQKIIKEIEGIAFIYLDKSDVVRHRLVKEIIQAYEVFQENHGTHTALPE